MQFAAHRARAGWRNRLAASGAFNHHGGPMGMGLAVTAKRAHFNPVDSQVGARMRARRIGLGISQEDLGKAVGVSFQQIQKYEKGANRIGASRLQKLAHALEVPISYFFEGMGGGEADGEGDDIIAFLATAQGLALARGFMRIKSAAVRRRILDFVAAVADD
jgi:transcriptional regulator with XRE-family HTH domain